MTPSPWTQKPSTELLVASIPDAAFDSVALGELDGDAARD